MDIDDYVPLPPSLEKRFYEPIILLHTLREVYRKCNRLTEPDLEGSRGKSAKETYFCFLNKLSQICDSHPNQHLGRTVSAITVLDSGTVEYRLASNQRDEGELRTVKEYLTDILHILHRVTDDEVKDKEFMKTVSSEILRKVLAFNRPRIEHYIEALISEHRLDFCIRYADGDIANEGRSVATALRSLRPHVEAASNAPRLRHDEFALHAERLLQKIDSHYESVLEDYLKQKLPDPMTNPDSPWVEVRHALGRLLSYFIAIKVFISARKLWPRLFVDFEVVCIPSSEPLTDPPEIRKNAKGIIQRMTRDDSLMKAYKTYAAQLQSHKLDERIRKHVQSGKFAPIVHAEVNLLESVLAARAVAERSGDGPLRFFHEAEFGAYIGTSKPTCLLCRLYFDAHPAGVLCRESHGNLYHNWRAPDVRRSDGPGPERLRREILETMVQKVRQETSQAIRQRAYFRKNHDSRDTPSNPLSNTISTMAGGSRVENDSDSASRTGQIEWESASVTPRRVIRASDSGELTSRMGQISLDDRSTRAWGDDDSRETTAEAPDFSTGQSKDDSRATTRMAPEPPTWADKTKNDDDDDDDDGGGAPL
ncbi:hypothetical protein VTH06DRAFT_270 [Thermothelomyces fergusii]